MENQRYLVVIVRPQAEAALLSPGRRSSILIPFNPEAIISSLVVEIWKRLARHDGAIPLTTETHDVSLHLGDENGPIIDIEDRLADIITDSQRERIVAVFKKKRNIATVIQAATHVVPILTQTSDHDMDSLSFRIITPSTTKTRDSCPILTMPISATVRQLHLSIANTLGCTGQPQETVEGWECNCNLAKELSLGYLDPTHFLVIRGKSIVEKFPLEVATVGSLQQALFSRFGQDIETRKRVTYHGATQDQDDSRIYTKIPVVSICSKQRHVPIHARVELDGSDRIRPQVLDLHTSELPIHPACFDSSVDELGLSALAVNGVVDIFAVHRTSSAQLPLLKGRSAIFRDLAHWEPSIPQSDRGMAIFLSSLRVFASILQNMQSDDINAWDAAYYVFDELTQFPPALRCLHLLVSGQTPTIFDCIALSQIILEVLRSYVAVDAITQDPARLFEGSRLLFGYILESAKSLRIASDTEVHSEDEVAKDLRYTSVFCTCDVRDHRTHEAVLHALQTSNGLIEETLFNSLQHGGLLAETHLQSFLGQVETDPRLARFALQSGGTCPEVLVLSLGGLKNIYGSQTGAPSHACDLNQLRDLLQLAEMCGRNDLAVHGPSQLASAISPCLTFDRNAHLAVYTGEEPCGMPGHSSIIFRPQHGEETIDPSVMERLIAPIVKSYEQDGSAVFDAYGGAQVRIMQDPDEIIMFCVDSSSSMCGLTDFSEVNEDDTDVSDRPHRLIEQELHQASSFDKSKESLMAHESFEDMIALVAKTSEQHKDRMAREVLSLLASLLCFDIKEKEKILETERRSSFRPVWHTHIHTLESDLGALKAFGAGLKVNEEALVQFLRFRATCLDLEAATRWSWSFGDPVPAISRSRLLSVLSDNITDVPSRVRCPISHTLMQDAVEASDGQTYSRSAIERWFSIRKTSPLHGAPLEDLSLKVRPDVRNEVISWISGPRETNTLDAITVTFDSRIGSFTRIVKRTTTSRDLYMLAYRGLKAEFEAFELSVHNTGTLPPNRNVTVSSIGLQDLDRIMIRVPEDADPLQIESYDSHGMGQDDGPEMCLVKVYEYLREEQLFAFWVREDTADSLLSVIWKYWRYQLDRRGYVTPEMRSVLTNVRDNGDGYHIFDVPKKTDNLFSFFTPSQCTGRLEPERLCTGDIDARISHSGYQVLKVMIGPEDEWKPDFRLTRLDVLKQMFEALINRMLAYNYKNHVGLVEFSSTAQVKMPISHVLENFRRATRELKAEGDTALWDALALAGDQIDQYATRFPGAKKRIVVISDGRDNKSSTNTCYGIVSSLMRRGISVDSVSIGNEDNTDLRTLSYLLGSYRFHPTSLANALAICEMEPFLSLSQRPPITLPLQSSRANIQTQFYSSRYRATATLVTDDIVPPIRDHPNMADDFFQLTSLASNGNSAVTATTRSNTGRARLRVPRLMNEIRTMAARGGHSKYDVYISTADVSFWKIVVEGPEGSPYSDGAFLLYLHADEAYPRLAPKARFVTKIKHPNVNVHGRICHSIFDRDWTSDTSMGTVLDTVYGLLYQPESSDPVNTTTTLGFFHDPVDFAEEARAHARKHASKTREQWKAEILGEMVV